MTFEFTDHLQDDRGDKFPVQVRVIVDTDGELEEWYPYLEIDKEEYSLYDRLTAAEDGRIDERVRRELAAAFIDSAERRIDMVRGQ